MKKSDTWMPFFVGDYLAATTRLTTEQHGAYILILLDYWRNGPPPNDDAVLAQVARLSMPAWKKVKPALIGFFDIKDGMLIQKRVERERGRAAEITEERSKAGKIGAEKRWQNHKQNGGKSIANAMAKERQTSKQNDGQPQPHKKETLTSSLTTSRESEKPPEGIDWTPELAFEYVCRASDWRAANDTQRQNGLGIIGGWLGLGCTLELILDGIARARQRDPAPTRSLKRFDSTIRGMRSDQLGGELPVTPGDVQRSVSDLAKRVSVQ